MAPRTRRRRPVDTRDLTAALGRLIKAVGARVGEGTPEELVALLSLHAEIDAAAQDAVDGLRSAGYTWDELGAATGTTRQAAIKKWLNGRG